LAEKKENDQERTAPDENKQNFLERIFLRKGFRAALLPLLAVITALIIGAFIIALSSTNVLDAWAGGDIGNALVVTVSQIFDAYAALLQGAFGRPAQMVEAFTIYSSTGETRPLLDAFRPLGESLVIATPYIFAGLAVALGFRGGLFNIGAEGQLFIGGMAAVFVGYSIEGLPAYIHLPLAILAGIIAGALWGFVPGILKALTGAHEVINTIMMNYIAFRLTDYMLQGPMAKPGTQGVTPDVLPSAYLPALFPRPMRLHWGFFVALAVAYLVYWFLWKTKYGLEIRMVGSNPHASRYAGIKIAIITPLTMCMSGALAGLAGASQMLGLDHRMVRAFSPGYGFDAIALALLGNSHPLGVVLASLLFGFMRAGAPRMQSVAGVPVEMIRVVQAMVIIFIAAPEIIRSIYRIKVEREEEILIAGWGS
jgi:simple sugar transport system permease protein